MLDTKNAVSSNESEEWFLDPLGLGVHTDLDTRGVVVNPEPACVLGRGCEKIEIMLGNQDGLHISFGPTKKTTTLGQGASQRVKKSETPLGLGNLALTGFSQAPVENSVSMGGHDSQKSVMDNRTDLGAREQFGCPGHTGTCWPPPTLIWEVG